MSDLELPCSYDAVLDRATYARLFDDLAASAEITTVRGRDRARTAAKACQTLEALRCGLDDGSLVAGQIVYRYAGETWIDTLLTTPQGVQLRRTSTRSGTSDAVDRAQPT